MAMDVTKLSSNWKQLQKKLETTNPAGDASSKTSLKRKAGSPTDNTPTKRSKGHAKKDHKIMENGFKKPRSKSFAAVEKPKVKQEEEASSRPTSLIERKTISKDVENEGVSPTAIAGKYIALDCEMVGVGPTPDEDSQLARVSLVNYHGEQIYDSYVLPKLPVTDYRTAVSGILPQHLEIGRPYKEVQADVSTFLQGRILVGHYLKSDLAMLQIKHPRIDIRDSSYLQKFRDMVGKRAVKLKDIAKLVCGLDIQTGEHNSMEDARAAMMIYKAEKEAFESELRKIYPQGPKQPQTNGSSSKKKKKKRK